MDKVKKIRVQNQDGTYSNDIPIGVEWGNVDNTPTTLADYGITSVPVSALSGVIDVSHIPPSALQRLTVVSNDTERFALTTATVQKGDTVKVIGTGRMYYIYDDTKLNSEAGYIEYSAGTAASVPWSGVSGKPSTVSGYGITDTYTKTEANNLLNGKVDTVSGKGLSTNDYTTAEKNKLSGIASGAEVNVNADWNATSGDAQILNKPTTVSGYGITDAYTEDEVDSLFDEKGLVDVVKGFDSVPYHFRKTPYGNRLKEKIVGGTVAWNQCAKEINSANYSTESNVTATFDNETIVFTSQQANYGIATSLLPTTKPNTVYLVSCEAMSASPITINALVGGYNGRGRQLSLTTALTHFSKIIKTVSNSSGAFYLYPDASSGVGVQITVKKLNVIDLTVLFGSTIADYIYNLEQTTEGAGVTLFRKLFNKDYYAYDAGSLQSVSGLVSHDEVGFNQWDEIAELGNISSANGQNAVNNNTGRSKNYIAILPNTTYYVKTSQACYLRFYDSDKNYIGYYSKDNKSNVNNSTFVSPDNAYYFRFVCDTAIADNSICINLSDTTKNGTYEPYVKHSYPLDDSLTLRGVPKLVDNEIKFDGDVYESDGKVTRRYGVVDLGTLTWVKGGSSFNTSSLQDVIKKIPASQTPNVMLSTRYVPVSSNNDSGVAGSFEFITNMSGTIIYRYPMDGIADAATFKTAMSGVMLVYELATPTEESAQPYANPQRCFEGGTEEYVTTGIVPVGHESTYVMNKAERFDALPDTASLDGDYIIRQENGVMKLVDADGSSDLVETEEGNPVVFETESAQIAKNTHLTFEPIQDLHGYDHPWPAGGGKQLIPYPYTESLPLTKNGVTFTHTGNGRIHVQGTATSTTYFNLYGSSSTPIPSWVKPNTEYTLRPITVSSKYFCQFILYGGSAYSPTGGTFTTPSDLSEYTGFALVIGVYNGAVVNDDIAPMLEYGSTATSYEPYSNICPISGLDEVEVKRTGKNLLPNNLAWRRNNDGAFDFIDADNSTTRIRTTSFAIKPGTYILSGVPSGSSLLSVRTYDSQKNRIEAEPSITGNIFTLGKNVAYIHLLFGGSGYDATTASVFQNTPIQLELGSTATDYEPYTESTVSVPLPTTIYGGTLDLETGVLRVDMFNYVYDGTETFNKSTTALNGFYNSLISGILPHSWPYMMDYHGISQIIKEKSNMFILSQNPQTYRNNYGVCYLDSGMNFNVNPDIFGTTTESFKAKLAELYQTGTPVSVVVKLATPIAYQLTPKQLALLKGMNHISTNVKSVKVTFKASQLATLEDVAGAVEVAKQNAIGESASYTDARLATELAPILGNFASAETSPASASHAVGEYLLYNNRLYKVLAAISAGQQLTVGTNVGQTNVAAELASQASAISALNSNTYLLVGGDELASATDLNTVTVPGNYYAASNERAVSIANSPLSVGFILKVEASSGIYRGYYRYIRQTAIAYNSVGEKFVRVANTSDGGSTWNFSSWVSS